MKYPVYLRHHNTTMMMMKAAFTICAAALLSVPAAGAFQTALSLPTMTKTTSTTSLLAAPQDDGSKNSDFMRWAKASRAAEAEDNLVEMQRPLGLILNQDEQGNVFVETIAPKGNAARSGKVCTMPRCSAKTCNWSVFLEWLTD
jgi:hypothetical protein